MERYAKQNGLAAPDFRTLFDSLPIVAMAVLPDDPIFTIVSVNKAFVNVSGVPAERILGRGIFEAFPDNPQDATADGVENLRQSFRRAMATGVPDRLPLQRYDVKQDSGGFDERYWSALNTPIFDAHGQIEYLLQTVDEVTEKVRAEKETLQAISRMETSATRFRQLTELSTFGVLLAELEGRILHLNPVLTGLLGYSEEEVKAGLVRCDGITPPEFSSLDENAARQLSETGVYAPYEKVYLAKDGRRVPVLVAGSMLESDREPRILASLVVDLTKRRESERDAFLVRLDDSMRPLVDADEIAEVTAKLLAEHLCFDGCVYCTFDADEETFHIPREYRRGGIASMVGTHRLSYAGAGIREVLRAGQPYLVEDIESDPKVAATRHLYRAAGVRAAATIPLLKAGRLVGALGLFQTESRRWLDAEIDLACAAANRCWESLERARVTREFQASEQRLRLAQRAGRIGSFEWVVDEGKLIWSPEMEALYDLPEGGFEGTFSDWTKRVVPADAVCVTRSLQACMARKQVDHESEFRVVLPDGNLRWLRGHAQFFYDEKGAPERMIGVNIDIDGQKKAEAELRQQWHAFDVALSNTPDLTYTFDLEGRFTYVNRAVLLIWEKALEDVLGKNFFELGYPPDLAGRLQEQIRHVIDTKKPLRDQAPFTRDNGQTRDYEYILTPVLAVGGTVEAVAGSTRDVTERNRAEAREREQEEQIREHARLESLGVMAGGIAHDFNNLLTAILGNASLLLENDEDKQIVAGHIMLAAERAADLTRQMLAFSGRGRFLVELVDLNTLVQENLILVRASLSSKVKVSLHLGEEPCLVMADRSQLQQVIMNLLINAAEAIGDAAGEVSIRTGIEDRESDIISERLHSHVPAGRYVVLAVQDNGSGIDPETLKRIFDPFFSTKFLGRGLGLAATLGIVKGHGGDIEVESQPGLGTRFRVLLPITKAEALPDIRKQTPELLHAALQTVLVVDDEAIVQHMAAAALQSRGFQVLLAANGSESLEVLRSNPDIVLVILDLTMPVMTGEQTLPILRQIRPEVPVILSSGFDELELSRRFSASGVAGVLQKPYTVAAMMAKVTSALQSSQ